MADAPAPDPADNQPPGYVPPKVWTWDKASGGQFANINRPVSGATHDTPLPVGLFIPFERAWSAVKEFMETEGALPKSIEWVANRDLPPNTFPDP